MVKKKALNRMQKPRRVTYDEISQRLNRGGKLSNFDRKIVTEKMSKLSLGKSPEDLLGPLITCAKSEDAKFLSELLRRENARRQAVANLRTENPSKYAENVWKPRAVVKAKKQPGRKASARERREIRKAQYLSLRQSLVKGEEELRGTNKSILFNYLNDLGINMRIETVRMLLSDLPGEDRKASQDRSSAAAIEEKLENTQARPVLEEILQTLENKKKRRKPKKQKKDQAQTEKIESLQSKKQDPPELSALAQKVELQKKIYKKIISEPEYFYCLKAEEVQWRLRNIYALYKKVNSADKKWLNFNIKFLEQLLNGNISFENIKLVDGDKYFTWPSVEVYFGTPGSEFDEELNEAGVLSLLGYNVRKDGPDYRDRRRVLISLFEGKIELPTELGEQYLQGWGAPETALRLKKMAYSLAAFTRQQKKKRTASSQAIEKWVDDLEFLKEKYYSRFVRQFNWPSY